MVTFTLTAIFMSSAALVLSSFMRSHTVASAVATEQDVASIVMETITSSLSAAQYRKDIFSEETGSLKLAEGEPSEPGKQGAECSFLIKNGGSEVWYVDGETGNVVRMYLKPVEDGGDLSDDGGYLALDYYVPPKAKEDGSPDSESPWERAPWWLGTGVYQNCVITKFEVGWIKDSSDDPINDISCLEVTLTLKNKLAGDKNFFTLKRCFDCYNLSADNIMIETAAS